MLYTAKTHTVGGREHGIARRSDARLEVKLVPPGVKRDGTNPEQLFAAGWSACFEAAMQDVAKQMKVKLPDQKALDTEVDLCYIDSQDSLQPRLNATIPGMERELA